MKDYTFWYSDTSTYKAGFQAKNAAEAERLWEDVFVHGSKTLEELPGFWNKHKGSDIESEPIEEID
jgi:hypothetical protein